ncbi:uncharacterized protein LOC116145155 [Pistacia vera]|uniref:uncharacterized protein LOC116145155 n=1 Tax=Pistacia vera TaxID=55513 RepID=UPI00126315D4|nr:uncharacterized protein LOC116145155 [Pistacia vera]
MCNVTGNIIGTRRLLLVKTRKFSLHCSCRPSLSRLSCRKGDCDNVATGVKKTITDNPKKLANLIDLVNLPSTLREFVGQSQISRLGCFMRVWSYIKTNIFRIQIIRTWLIVIKVEEYFDGQTAVEQMNFLP